MITDNHIKTSYCTTSYLRPARLQWRWIPQPMEPSGAPRRAACKHCCPARSATPAGKRAALGRGRGAAIPELSPQWKRNFSPINAQQDPCEHWVPQPMEPIQAPRRAFANIAVQQDLRHRLGERATSGRGKGAAIPELSPQWMRNFSPITAQQDPSGKERGAAIPELRPQWMRNFSPIIAQQDRIGDGTRN